MRATRDETTEKVVAAAKYIAGWGARTYLEVNDETVDTDTLARAIIVKLRTAIPEALSDAKEAFAANMHDAAVETFRVSIVLAGVEAAKECSCR